MYQPLNYMTCFVPIMTDLPAKKENADIAACALSEFRDCPRWDICSGYSCRQLLCYDPDYLEDADYGYRNPSKYGKLWREY
jgi:hypothetical protein